jgi:hypothetical protein
MSEPRYASPQALRRAVTDRLRELAEQRSGDVRFDPGEVADGTSTHQ